VTILDWEGRRKEKGKKRGKVVYPRLSSREKDSEATLGPYQAEGKRGGRKGKVTGLYEIIHGGEKGKKEDTLNLYPSLLEKGGARTLRYRREGRKEGENQKVHSASAGMERGPVKRP